jgi:hypothetical protein
MPIKLLILFLLCFFNHVIYAEDRYAGDFLSLGVGARPLGMGGSFSAISDDSTAAYWNPAGLGGLHRSEITFMRSTINDLDSYSFVNYIHPVGKDNALGVSWMRVGIDDIPVTAVKKPAPVGPGNRPEIKDNFSLTDNAFMLSYGRKYSNLFVGVNAKLIYISGYRKHNALGVGGDLGFLWTSSSRGSSRFSTALVVQDFFRTKLYWNTPPEKASQAAHTDTILQNFRLGFAYRQKIESFRSHLILSVDVDSLYDFEFHYGTEYVFSDLLSIRFGVQERKGVKTIHNITAGVGLRLGFITGAAFSVDYAFLGNNDLGNSNQLSLIFRF